MDALTAVRSNATGIFSPTREQRIDVLNRLAQTKGEKIPALALATKAAGSGTPSAAVDTNTNVSTGTSSTRETNTDLDRDAFLQLLVLQLQNQDPLSPVDNQQMIAQLAQFSALEQMTQLNKQFEVITGNIDQLNFISASLLVGKEVTGVTPDGILIQGIVESVHLNGSIVMLTVDGQLMSMAGITGILEPTPDAPVPDTAIP